MLETNILMADRDRLAVIANTLKQLQAAYSFISRVDSAREEADAASLQIAGLDFNVHLLPLKSSLNDKDYIDKINELWGLVAKEIQDLSNLMASFKRMNDDIIEWTYLEKIDCITDTSSSDESFSDTVFKIPLEEVQNLFKVFDVASGRAKTLVEINKLIIKISALLSILQEIVPYVQEIKVKSQKFLKTPMDTLDTQTRDEINEFIEIYTYVFTSEPMLTKMQVEKPENRKSLNTTVLDNLINTVYVEFQEIRTGKSKDSNPSAASSSQKPSQAPQLPKIKSISIETGDQKRQPTIDSVKAEILEFTNQLVGLEQCLSIVANKCIEALKHLSSVMKSTMSVKDAFESTKGKVNLAKLYELVSIKREMVALENIKSLFGEIQNHKDDPKVILNKITQIGEEVKLLPVALKNSNFYRIFLDCRTLINHAPDSTNSIDKFNKIVSDVGFFDELVKELMENSQKITDDINTLKNRTEYDSSHELRCMNLLWQELSGNPIRLVTFFIMIKKAIQEISDIVNLDSGEENLLDDAIVERISPRISLIGQLARNLPDQYEIILPNSTKLSNEDFREFKKICEIQRDLLPCLQKARQVRGTLAHPTSKNRDKIKEEVQEVLLDLKAIGKILNNILPNEPTSLLEEAVFVLPSIVKDYRDEYAKLLPRAPNRDSNAVQSPNEEPVKGSQRTTNFEPDATSGDGSLFAGLSFMMENDSDPTAIDEARSPSPR